MINEFKILVDNLNFLQHVCKNNGNLTFVLKQCYKFFSDQLEQYRDEKDTVRINMGTVSILLNMVNIETAMFSTTGDSKLDEVILSHLALCEQLLSELNKCILAKKEAG